MRVMCRLAMDATIAINLALTTRISFAHWCESALYSSQFTPYAASDGAQPQEMNLLAAHLTHVHGIA